jgi:hypothetical protein
MVVELVERPLPKPSDEGYIVARLLEALGEARLALEYLERGFTRNAAVRPSRPGRRFWRLCCGLSWIS